MYNGLTLCFWNIEKANKITDEEDAEPETQSDLRSWYAIELLRNRFDVEPFDVLICAEVANYGPKGKEFAERLAENLNESSAATSVPGHPYHMRGVFHWSENAAGNRSSCNFAVIWNEAAPGLEGLGVRAEFHWTPDDSEPRPTIILSSTSLAVGGLHAKSGRRDVATQQVFEACIELENKRNRAVLIGDLNIPFDEFSKSTEKQLQEWGWSKAHPGFSPTHVSRDPRYSPAILDYAWHNGGVTLHGEVETEEEHKVFFPYSEWNVIDHAPIQYKVRW
jgi:hypothetical protein